jgi:hypothetical protein
MPSGHILIVVKPATFKDLSAEKGLFFCTTPLFYRTPLYGFGHEHVSATLNLFDPPRFTEWHIYWLPCATLNLSGSLCCDLNKTIS